jgi:hypothetical protein
MVMEYSEPEVTLLQWPGLKELATAYMGRHRNSFWWENRKGKLVFFYNADDDKSYYRTEFPADFHSKKPGFSEPVLMDSIPVKE